MNLLAMYSSSPATNSGMFPYALLPFWAASHRATVLSMLPARLLCATRYHS